MPRHHFVRRFLRGEAEVTERDGDRWLDGVYADEVLLTACRPAGAAGPELPTSSSSQPAIMAVMLDRLAATAGMSVLEIGTGTGYNAALLCYRLGDHRVTSVDLDPELTALADRRLAELGYRPTVRPADGALGWPERAPYDRILATCAVGAVPPAWVRQVADGGRIVAPFAGGGLLVLDKTAPDEVTGRFDPAAALFMPLRQRIEDPLGLGERPDSADLRPVRHGTTVLDPARLSTADPELQLWLELHLTGLRVRRGRHSVVVRTAEAEARVGRRDERGRWPVQQRGDRAIWDAVVAALAAWDRFGHPVRTRLGVSASIDPDRQSVWLDAPDGPYSWPLRP
ncbi:MAG TPA: methyltransferase domain-containing protein [Mycobacteriales bacterium]|nr:methyltransferase domain-containing protein [Mycobacteriales bacterium]